MRRVLIIAYYWPPAGGGGVQRWLKFTKYLPEFGWQPVVYIPHNPQYPLIDQSLVQQVPEHVETIRGHIWEARRFYRRFKKLRHGSRWNYPPEMDTLFYRDPKGLSWFARLSLFMRSNLFVPDSRSLWIGPSYRRLKKWLAQNPVDVIVSTGPPHTCHLIALKLKKRTGLPWVADFRDPWLEIDYFQHLLLTNHSRKKHEQLHQQVMTMADQVITVSWSWSQLFENHGARSVAVITNGFDLEDLKVLNNAPVGDGVLRIAHVGTLELDRNPTGLWAALRHLFTVHPETRQRIEIHLAGKIEDVNALAVHDLADRIVNHGYLPHHEALEVMSKSDILLLTLNRSDSSNARGRIPGKLFEYIAMKKPILLLGGEYFDAGNIVRGLGNSWCVPSDDKEQIKDILLSCLSSAYMHRHHHNFDFSRFERKHLTASLAEILEKTIVRSIHIPKPKRAELPTGSFRYLPQ